MASVFDMTSHAPVRASHNKRTAIALADIDYGLRNIDDATLSQLTRVLRLLRIEHDNVPASLWYKGFIQPSQEWRKKQHTQSHRLDARLLQPTSLWVRAAVSLGMRGIPLLPKSGNLCLWHVRLDPRIIRSLLMMVMDECTVHADRFRNKPDLVTANVKDWLARLQEVTGLNLGSQMMIRIYGSSQLSPAVQFLGQRCEACVLAAVGGSYHLLRDIRTGLIARQAIARIRNNDQEHKPPRLLRVVLSWIAHLQLPSQHKLNTESDILLDEILCCYYHIAEEEAQSLQKRSNKPRYVRLKHFGVLVPHPSEWSSTKMANKADVDVALRTVADAEREARSRLKAQLMLPLLEFGRLVVNNKPTDQHAHRHHSPLNPKESDVTLAEKGNAVEQAHEANRAPAARPSEGKAKVNNQLEVADDAAISRQKFEAEAGLSRSSFTVASAIPEPLSIRRIGRRITDLDRLRHAPSAQSLVGVLCPDDFVSPLAKVSHGGFSQTKKQVAASDNQYTPARQNWTTTSIKRKPVPPSAAAPQSVRKQSSEAGPSRRPSVTASTETNWAPSTTRRLPCAPPSSVYSTDRAHAAHLIRTASDSSRKPLAPPPSSVYSNNSAASYQLAAPTTDPCYPRVDTPQDQGPLIDQPATFRTVRGSQCGPGIPPPSWM